MDAIFNNLALTLSAGIGGKDGSSILFAGCALGKEAADPDSAGRGTSDSSTGGCVEGTGGGACGGRGIEELESSLKDGGTGGRAVNSSPPVGSAGGGGIAPSSSLASRRPFAPAAELPLLYPSGGTSNLDRCTLFITGGGSGDDDSDRAFNFSLESLPSAGAALLLLSPFSGLDEASTLSLASLPVCPSAEELSCLSLFCLRSEALRREAESESESELWALPFCLESESCVLAFSFRADPWGAGLLGDSDDDEDEEEDLERLGSSEESTVFLSSVTFCLS